MQLCSYQQQPSQEIGNQASKDEISATVLFACTRIDTFALALFGFGLCHLLWPR